MKEQHLSFGFKKLGLNGVQTLVKWAGEEGWNPGVNDAAIFWNTDPEGFWGYYDNGELIAGGSVVSYDGNFGFMGFFIVKPGYRGRGIGRSIWYKRRDKLLLRLNAGAAIGMDGVVSMQSFYNRGGFRIAFRDERYERNGEKMKSELAVTPVKVEDIGAVLNYDRKCFGFERTKFMLSWLNQPEVKSFKYMNEEGMKGFVVMRKCIKGYKAGPLFADNLLVAEALYRACLNAVPGEPVYLDIPAVNEDAVALVKKYKASYVFECARMYYGKPPELPVRKVFGITTFELG
ncbi:MAG: N-acetyltransferase [Sphingobacteriia bacterium]|nr:N-acetyltransferase [Sphingobacteriia bacterium]